MASRITLPHEHSHRHQRTRDTATTEAKENILAEWDFQNLTGGGLVSPDLTGNGYNITWAVAPTVSAAGCTFGGGTIYGTVTLPAMNSDFSVVVLSRSVNLGYYIFGNRDGNDGVAVRSYNPGHTWSVSDSGNSIGQQPNGGATVMTSSILRYDINRFGRAWGLTQSFDQILNALRADDGVGVSSSRTLWLVGGQFDGTGTGTPTTIPTTGTIAYAAVFNKAISYNQSQKFAAYLRDQLASRSVTFI